MKDALFNINFEIVKYLLSLPKKYKITIDYNDFDEDEKDELDEDVDIENFILSLPEGDNVIWK